MALLLRGFPGLLESALAATDVLPNGFLGMTDQEVYGEADPSAYTIWSMRAVDAYFALGSVLYFATLRLSGRTLTRGRTQGERPEAVGSLRHEREPVREV